MGHEVTDHDLLQQFQHAMQCYAGEKIVKIFTSGSFFDEHEIPPMVRNHVFETLSHSAEKINVESRPQYVTLKTVAPLEKVLSKQQLQVGMGLETSNDFIRTYAVNKGFSFNEYKKAALLLRDHEFLVKTYVLVKPPFLTEHEAVQDCLQTIKDSTVYSDTISLNPTNVQRHTLVEYLWKRHQYRPPWLWSIVDILKQGKKHTTTRLQCDVSGGGNPRGPHNCSVCDQKILQAITDFSLHQKPKVFDNLRCDCHEQWLDQLDGEALTYGSCVDFSRWSE